MKLTFFLSILTVFQLLATESYSQLTKLTLRLDDVTISDALKEIENQSEFFFLYSPKLIDVERKVNIDSENETIADILSDIFGGDVKFAAYDRQVILTPNEQSGVLSVLPQQNRISGRILDSDGQPMVGVNIVEKGTTNGTLSDQNGNYVITVASANSVLNFSFIGYVTQEVYVGTQNNIIVTLAESVSVVDEVIVVGYSTQSRRSLTGAISKVDASALTDLASANPINRLQGKASGVTIINKHTPGGGSLINIRGLSTINNNDPLYVIDGVPTKSNISQLNPNEIESITILKDATSAAIYGARGANGVIIITTKRGTPGKAKLSFTSRAGFSSFNNYFDLLNTQEFGEMLWLELKNAGKVPSNALYGSGSAPVIPDYTVPAGAKEGAPGTDPALYNHTPGAGFYNITKANKIGTNWYDAIKQTGMLQEYNLALSGGGEKGLYAFNVGYSKEEGIVKHTSFDRYSIRSNADTKVNKWLEIGESLGVSFSNSKGYLVDNWDGIPLFRAQRMWPIIPVYDIMGNFAGTKGTGTGSGDNPMGILYRNRDDFARNLRGIGNAYANFNIMKGLSFKSLMGFDYLTYNSKDLTRQNPEFQEATSAEAVSMSDNYTIQWNWSNVLNYSKEFGSHLVRVLVGSEAVSTDYTSVAASRSTYFSDNVNYMYLDSGEKNQTNSGSASTTRTASYFGRVNYGFMNKYLVELTFRRDGSSRFGANNRWANFPAASVGWRISEEGFMAGIKDFVDDLKLRASYGVSGNDEIGNYNEFSTYSSNAGYSFYSISGAPNSATAGFYSSKVGNPDAKWETTKTMNFGINATVLNNTLVMSLDLWQRKTKDMLFRVAIPSIEGSATAPSVNIGDMDNKGYDLDINYTNQALNGDITYNLGLILSHYKNKIVKISNNETEFIQGSFGYTRATKGTSYPEFFGLIVDGIFQDESEASSHPVAFGGAYNMPGHYKFRDINNDGIINDNDRTYIGSPHPKFTTGLNLSIGYKAFDLGAFFYSSYGNKVSNQIAGYMDYGWVGNRSKDRLYKSWGSPYLDDDQDAILPLADENSISYKASTARLENGSFLRMKTLQLSYTLPKNLSQKLMIENLQVYIQGENLFTLTKYKGLDPEVNMTSANLGVDVGQWPSARQIFFGIKLDL